MFYGSTHKITVIVIAVVILAIVIIVTVMIIYIYIYICSINMRTKTVYKKHGIFFLLVFACVLKWGHQKCKYHGLAHDATRHCWGDLASGFGGVKQPCSIENCQNLSHILYPEGKPRSSALPKMDNDRHLCTLLEMIPGCNVECIDYGSCGL